MRYYIIHRMKNHQKKIIFLEIVTIFLLFCVEPLISLLEEKPILTFSYSFFYFFVYGLFSLYFFLSTKDNQKKDIVFSKNILLQAIFSLVLLLFFGFICSFLDRVFFESKMQHLPSKNLVNTLLGITCAVIFEELLYRRFFPYKIEKLIENTNLPQKVIFILVEIIPLTIFALCHYSNGIFASINALFAGSILRRLYLKTKIILFPMIIHALYNYIIFFTQ